MQRPKIRIAKAITLNAEGNFRMYHPLSTEDNHQKGVVTFNLDPKPDYSKKDGSLYPYLELYTEKQLVTFIKDNYGWGRYLVIALLKGRRGLYCFWKGELQPDGWIFHNQEYDKKELKSLNNELTASKDEEEKQFIEEEINDIKQVAKEEAKEKRYGFYPFLKSSGRRGEWHSWDEADEGFISHVPLNKNPSEMSVDELNNMQ